MRTFLKQISLTSLLVVIVFMQLSAGVRLPALVSDGMVLQREQKVKIWGWAAPGEKVTVKIN